MNTIKNWLEQEAKRVHITTAARRTLHAHLFGRTSAFGALRFALAFGVAAVAMTIGGLHSITTTTTPLTAEEILAAVRTPDVDPNEDELLIMQQTIVEDTRSFGCLGQTITHITDGQSYEQKVTRPETCGFSAAGKTVTSWTETNNDDLTLTTYHSYLPYGTNLINRRLMGDGRYEGLVPPHGKIEGWVGNPFGSPLAGYDGVTSSTTETREGEGGEMTWHTSYERVEFEGRPTYHVSRHYTYDGMPEESYRGSEYWVDEATMRLVQYKDIDKVMTTDSAPDLLITTYTERFTYTTVNKNDHTFPFTLEGWLDYYDYESVPIQCELYSSKDKYGPKGRNEDLLDTYYVPEGWLNDPRIADQVIDNCN